jgi:hypothetical protein
VHAITLSERLRGSPDANTISIEGAVQPLVVCRLRRTPSDDEVIVALRELELLLDRNVQHALLVEHTAGCPPRLDHIHLWRAFEHSHARRLERCCAGIAVVSKLPTERFASTRASRVPEARFDDAISARAWLAERLAPRVS